MAVEESSLPGYRKVKQILVQQITEGRMKPGDRITSERALAESLGISRLTVSRAIGELVNDGILTRRRGSGTYVADWRSRPLRSKSGYIGLVLPNTTDIPTSEMVRGVTAVLKDSGYHIIFADSANRYKQEEEQVAALRKDQVDGLIVMPVDTADNVHVYREAAYAGLPFVFVDRYLPNVDSNYVVTDNHWGAFQATKWLIERGHRRIAHFTIFNSNSTVVCQRQQGYFDALTHFGIPHDPELLCPPSVYEYRTVSYKHALAYVRHLPEPATAVFAMNDHVVCSTLQSMTDLGLEMPGDMEVAGFFDGGNRLGMHPPFMKVVQPSYEIGFRAAQLLLDLIDSQGEQEIQRIQMQPSLVYGGAPMTFSSEEILDL